MSQESYSGGPHLCRGPHLVPWPALPTPCIEVTPGTFLPSSPACLPLSAPAHRRYASYCANIARTYFVDPNKQQEAEYAALFSAQQAAVAALVEGAPMSAAYEAVVKTLQVAGAG